MYQKIWNKDFIYLILSNFFMYITYYAIISVLPIYLVSSLHSTKSQVGIVVGIYTIAAVFIRPFTGYTLDRFNRHLIFIFTLALYAILFSGFLFAASILALTCLRFLQGLTWGYTTVSGSTIAVDIIPDEKRGEGIGYFAMSTTLGMSVGPLIGVFITHQWSYTAMFAAGVVISIISLYCGYRVKLPKEILAGKKIKFKWNTLFDKSSIRPSINLFVLMIPYGGLLSFIAIYGREIGVQNSSLFFLIFAVGIAISRFTAGKAFDKNGPRNIITLCLGLLILSFPFLASVKTPAGFYISALMIGFGNGVVFPVFQSMVNNLADSEHRGAANSTLYTSTDLGMGLGMVMGGYIAQHISTSAIFLCSAFLEVIGLIIFRLFVLNYYEKRIKL
jgi:predicted MFS family arabinose efflux permease